MSNLFPNALWPGLSAWILLYISDYSLTLACARMYRAGVNEKVVLEGSYEITPYFQRDIDSLRRFSPRFFAMLVVIPVYLALLWFVAKLTAPELYDFAVGAFILIQFPVHARHFRNLHFFRAALHTQHIRGRIEYSRLLLLQGSAVELLTFSGFYLLIFALTRNWFLLGGTASCLATALKHLRLARKLPANRGLEQPQEE